MKALETFDALAQRRVQNEQNERELRLRQQTFELNKAQEDRIFSQQEFQNKKTYENEWAKGYTAKNLVGIDARSPDAEERLNMLKAEVAPYLDARDMNELFASVETQIVNFKVNSGWGDEDRYLYDALQSSGLVSGARDAYRVTSRSKSAQEQLNNYVKQAVESGVSVADIPWDKLRSRLPSRNSVTFDADPGVTLGDSNAGGKTLNLSPYVYDADAVDEFLSTKGYVGISNKLAQDEAANRQDRELWQAEQQASVAKTRAETEKTRVQTEGYMLDNQAKQPQTGGAAGSTGMSVKGLQLGQEPNLDEE